MSSSEMTTSPAELDCCCVLFSGRGRDKRLDASKRERDSLGRWGPDR